VGKNNNPRWEHKIHLCMFSSMHDWCSLYHTWFVFHLLDKTLAGQYTHQFSMLTDNGGWRWRWRQWMSSRFYQWMIYRSLQFGVQHRNMCSESHPDFHSLQIENCTAKLIVKTTIKQEGNFELTSQRLLGHLNLSQANSKATILQICVRDFHRNL